MLEALTPLPGTIAMRFPAAATNFASEPRPWGAVVAPPEVKMRAAPVSITSSSAASRPAVSGQHAKNNSLHPQPLGRRNSAAHVRDFLRRIDKVPGARPDHRKDRQPYLLSGLPE